MVGLDRTSQRPAGHRRIMAITLGACGMLLSCLALGNIILCRMRTYERLFSSAWRAEHPSDDTAFLG